MLAAVGAGGALGALARYAVLSWAGSTQALGLGRGGPSGALLAVNVGGSFLMGLLVCVVLHRPGHPVLHPLLGTGFLGGFTTFSAFAQDVRALSEGGHALTGVGHAVLTPVLAIGACWAGVRAMHRILGRPSPPQPKVGDLPGPAGQGPV